MSLEGQCKKLALLVVFDRAHELSVPVRPRLRARVVMTKLGLWRLGNVFKKPIEK